MKISALLILVNVHIEIISYLDELGHGSVEENDGLVDTIAESGELE